jgi:threonine dehydrogenase-like Zn-dependent dehydrogenase
VVEKSELRRGIVKGLGVEVLNEPDDHLYNVVFDATGVAAVMSKSLNLVNPAGRLVFAGVCPEDIPISDPLLHKREITLLATRNSCHQFPRIIRMIEQGRIDTSPWVTHRIGLADVPARFADLQKEPNLVKAVVDITDDNL